MFGVFFFLLFFFRGLRDKSLDFKQTIDTHPKGNPKNLSAAIFYGCFLGSDRIQAKIPVHSLPNTYEKKPPPPPKPDPKPPPARTPIVGATRNNELNFLWPNMACLRPFLTLFFGMRFFFCLQVEASCLQWSFFTYSRQFQLFYLQLELFLLTLGSFSAYNGAFFTFTVDNFSFLLTIGAFLLTILAFCLQTVGAFFCLQWESASNKGLKGL